MPTIAEILTEHTFSNLRCGLSLKTPDRIKSSPFTIQKIHQNSIIIKTISGTPVEIKKEAFLATLKYLLQEGHSKFKKIKIQSSNDPKLSGPLCAVSRNVNSNVRCINYILPIFEHFGFIETDGKKPNKTWYI